MMYIVGFKLDEPNVAVRNTHYGHPMCVESGWQCMLVDTNDRSPHCRWMFVS